MNRRAEHVTFLKDLPLCGLASGWTTFGVLVSRMLEHPAAQVVAVIQSVWRQHEDIDAAIETFALLRAALLALRPDPKS